MGRSNKFLFFFVPSKGVSKMIFRKIFQSFSSELKVLTKKSHIPVVVRTGLVVVAVKTEPVVVDSVFVE